MMATFGYFLNVFIFILALNFHFGICDFFQTFEVSEGTSEITDVVLSNTQRSKRSTRNRFGYQSFDLELKIEQDIQKLSLVQNENLDSLIPVYSLENGVISKESLNGQVGLIFYQALHHSAGSFVLQFDENGTKSIYGRIEIGDHQYSIQSMKNQAVHTGLNRFKVARVRKPELQDPNPILLNTGFKGNKVRSKRATGSHQIELLMVVDYSIYKYWYDKSTKPSTTEKDAEALSSVRQYYAFVINGMDTMYKNVQSVPYTMAVVYAGIVIAKTPGDSSWTESVKVMSTTPNRVDSSQGLTNFESWVQQTSGLPGHDHAMLFTKYDLTFSGSSANTGLANQGAICTARSQSIVEEGFDFIVITVASHELGHSLNSLHDGQGNTCSPSNAYIMAATSTPQQGIIGSNLWRFSACSVGYFTTLIDFLDRSNNNCMRTLSPGFDPNGLFPYNQNLAGQIYSADDQCQQVFGSQSYMCREQYNGDFTSMCSLMWCYNPTTTFCQSVVAGAGTLCGDKKWCISGVCVSDSRAPSGNENCLYGDRRGVIFSNVGWTCADMFAADPSQCSVAGVLCCGSCLPPSTTSTQTTTTPTTTSATVATVATTTPSPTTTTVSPTTTVVITTTSEGTTGSTLPPGDNIESKLKTILILVGFVAFVVMVLGLICWIVLCCIRKKKGAARKQVTKQPKPYDNQGFDIMEAKRNPSLRNSNYNLSPYTLQQQNMANNLRSSMYSEKSLPQNMWNGNY